MDVQTVVLGGKDGVLIAGRIFSKPVAPLATLYTDLRPPEDLYPISHPTPNAT
jgi:hypothetical protein